MAQYGEGVYGEGTYGVGGAGSYGTGDYGTDEYGHPLPSPRTKTWIPADPTSSASVVDDAEVRLDALPFNRANKWRPSAGESLLQVEINGRAIVDGTITKDVGFAVSIVGNTTVYAQLSATAVKEISATSLISGIMLNALPVSMSFTSGKAALKLRPSSVSTSASQEKLSLLLNGRPDRASSLSLKAVVFSDGHNQAITSGTVKTAASIPGNRQNFHTHSKNVVIHEILQTNASEHLKSAVESVLLLPDLRFNSSAHVKSSTVGVNNYSNANEHLKLVNFPVRLYEWYVLQDTPVAYWKLDDAVSSTTVLDSSGNNHHGNVVRFSDFIGESFTTDSGNFPVDVEVKTGYNDYSGVDEILGAPTILHGYPSSSAWPLGSAAHDYIGPTIQVFPDPINSGSTDVDWMYSESYSFDGWVGSSSNSPDFTAETPIIITPSVQFTYHYVTTRDVRFGVESLTTEVYLVFRDRDPIYPINALEGKIILASASCAYTISEGRENSESFNNYNNVLKPFYNGDHYFAVTHNGVGDAGTVTRVYFNDNIVWSDVHVSDVVAPPMPERGPNKLSPITPPPPGVDEEYFTLPPEIDPTYEKIILGPSKGDTLDHYHYLSFKEGVTPYDVGSRLSYKVGSNRLAGSSNNLRVAHIAYYAQELSYKDVWTHYAAGSGRWNDLARKLNAQEHIKTVPLSDPAERVFQAHEKLPIAENPNRKSSSEIVKASVLLYPEKILESAAGTLIALTNNDKTLLVQEHSKLVATLHDDSRITQGHTKSGVASNPSRIVYQEHTKASTSGHIKQIFQTHTKVGLYTDDGWYDSSAHTKVTVLLQENASDATTNFKTSVLLSPDKVSVSAGHSKFTFSELDLEKIASSVVTRTAILFQPYNTTSNTHIKSSFMIQSYGHNVQTHTKASVDAAGARVNSQEHSKIVNDGPLPAMASVASAIITISGVETFAVGSARLVSAMHGVSSRRISSAHTKTLGITARTEQTSSSHSKVLANIDVREMTGAAHVKAATPAPNKSQRKRGWGLIL